MTSPAQTAEAAEERRELWRLAAGFAVGAGVIHWVFAIAGLPLVLLAFSLTAFAGAAAFGRIGHDVHLIFSLIALAIGRIMSWLGVALMYVVGIAFIGSILRLFGVDRLDRDFARCRTKPTMFVDPPETTVESFRRQS